MYNEITKLQLVLLIVHNARRLGWNASVIHNKIKIRKNNNMLNELDKNHEKLLRFLIRKNYINKF